MNSDISKNLLISLFWDVSKKCYNFSNEVKVYEVVLQVEQTFKKKSSWTPVEACRKFKIAPTS